MNKKDREKLVKLLLEAGRWGLFAGISAIVAFLLENLAGLELDPTFELILMSGLRFADSALHKTKVAEKGLSRF